MHKRPYRFVIVVMAIAAFVGGCASTPAKEEIILFPSYPEQPRVVYVRSLTGQLDFRKPSLLDAIFGTPVGTDFKKPFGVAARDDKVYVSDGVAHAVVVFDLKLEKVTYLGTSSPGRLAAPTGVAVASDGIVYVTEGRLNQVFVYDPAGKYLYSFGKKDEFKNIAGIAINDDLGRLYVADSYGHTVRVYTLKGEFLFQFGQLGHDEGEFRYPTQVVIDRKNGNVYVTDTQNFRVQVFDRDGKFLSMFGSLGDSPGTFSRPKGIGMDSEGHIYVADAAFSNFQIFNQEGRILLAVGRPGNTAGRFRLPAGLAVDEKDRIYVVDQVNTRVEVFQYLSEDWIKNHPDEYKKYLEPPVAAVDGGAQSRN